jgi:hypothetical protein
MSNNNSDDKKKESNLFFYERKVDDELWKRVVTLATGPEVERLTAIDILLKKHYSLPEQAVKLLKELSKDKALAVRLKIANDLSKKESENIPYILYTDLIGLLRNDQNSEIKAIGEKLYKEKLEPLNNLWGVCYDANKRLLNSLQASNPSLEAFRRQSVELSQVLSKYRIPRLETPSDALIAWSETQKQLNSIISKNLFQASFHYFPTSELHVVKESLPVTEKSRAALFEQKLKDCLPSDGNKVETKKALFDSKWRLYQDAYKEILSYTLIPPLLGPLEESSTASTGGSQRRDLIFNIPHDVNGFWHWVSIVHESLSIIVECKNYGTLLKQNQVVITSKYLGRKRLGNMAIILTRKGLSKNAIKEQKRLWLEDDKLILCLNDQDLIKMLQLKEHKDDPSKVIDDALRSFRESLA